MKPLFVALKTEFYNAFESGEKTVEYRPYGRRWNENTCPVGRPVVLSHGYGKKRRLQGVVAQFEKSTEPTLLPAWKECYGDKGGVAACIHVKLNPMDRIEP